MAGGGTGARTPGQAPAWGERSPGGVRGWVLFLCWALAAGVLFYGLGYWFMGNPWVVVVGLALLIAMGFIDRPPLSSKEFWGVLAGMGIGSFLASLLAQGLRIDQCAADPASTACSATEFPWTALALAVAVTAVSVVRKLMSSRLTAMARTRR